MRKLSVNMVTPEKIAFSTTLFCQARRDNLKHSTWFNDERIFIDAVSCRAARGHFAG